MLLLSPLSPQVNRDDDLASAEDYLHVSQWNLLTLRRKLDEFLATQSMRSVTAQERWKTVDLLSWLLQPRAEDRPKCFGEILQHIFFEPAHGKWRMSSLHVLVACGNDNRTIATETALSEFDDDELNSSEHPLGSTPLHIAVIENKLCFLEHLISRGADANKPDHTGRTPIQHLLLLLQNPVSKEARKDQLCILAVLCESTKYDPRAISSHVSTGREHLSRAKHFVDACKSDRVCATEWGQPLAQLLLQQAAEHSWLDACRHLVTPGAHLDEPSPWDARLPRQIGMASDLRELRDFFQTHSTVCRKEYVDPLLPRLLLITVVAYLGPVSRALHSRRLHPQLSQLYSRRSGRCQ